MRKSAAPLAALITLAGPTAACSSSKRAGSRLAHYGGSCGCDIDRSCKDVSAQATLDARQVVTRG
jgi:hypothetical protein